MKTNMLVLVLVVCALGGCRAHVAFDELPSRHAALERRQKALTEYTPKRIVSRGYRYRDPHAHGLLLANGTIVEDPRDFAALLGESDAATADSIEHAERAAQLEETATYFHAAGLGASTIMLGGMIAGALLQLDGDENPANATTGMYLFSASAILGSLSGVALVMPVVSLQDQANRERLIAFHLFESDLRRRLDLEKTPEELTARWIDAPAPAAEANASQR